MVVRSELEKYGYKPVSIELGEVEINNEISDARKAKTGFSLAGCRVLI
jgi:hypothetical protein